MKYIVWIEIALVVILWAVAGYLFWMPGKVSINVTSTDAQIFVDGALSGSGSTTISLKRGHHSIKIQKEGFTGLNYSVLVKARQTVTINKELNILPEAKNMASGVTSIEKGQNSSELLAASFNGKTMQKYDITRSTWETISKINFGESIRSTWASNKYLVYLWRKDGLSGVADLKRYDLVNQDYKSWGKGVLDLAWSPKGNEAAYLYKPGNGEFSIIKATAGNKSKDRIYDLRQSKISNNVRVQWTPDEDVAKKQLVIVDKDIYFYTFYTRELKPMTTEGKVQFGRMSPDGKYVVYGTEDGLYRMTRDGKSQKFGPAIATFAWMDNTTILAYAGGEFYKIDTIGGSSIPLGYNGKRLGQPENLVVYPELNQAYMIIKGKLIELNLVPKEIIEDSK